MDHPHEIRVERLVPCAEHQGADRPEIDQRERVRIRSLANALFNATVREPDRARRLAVAERIAALHTQHGQEPAVREPLALALYNVTVGEPGSSVHTDFVRRAARFATEPSIMRRYPSRAVR